MKAIFKVYVTPAGKKYHITQECRTLFNRNIKCVDLNSKLTKHYKPCTVCSMEIKDNSNRNNNFLKRSFTPKYNENIDFQKNKTKESHFSPSAKVKNIFDSSKKENSSNNNSFNDNSKEGNDSPTIQKESENLIENLKNLNDYNCNFNKKKDFYIKNYDYLSNDFYCMGKEKQRQAQRNIAKKKINWKNDDFLSLEETIYRAEIIDINQEKRDLSQSDYDSSFGDKELINNISVNTKINKKILEKKHFMFNFEIKTNKEFREPIIINVGFKIDYIDDMDINLKREINPQNSSLMVSSSFETYIIIRKFSICNNTEKIYVLINLEEKKFFIVGESELNKRKKKEFLTPLNSNILYIRKFFEVQLPEIYNIEPIFIYDKKIPENANIYFNEKILK